MRVIKNGALLATPFVTVTVDDFGERGLLGVAFDPDFATNQYVYVYYTATSPAMHNRAQPLHRQRRRGRPGKRASCSSTSTTSRRHQPQRRGDPLRSGRQALRRRSATTQRRQRADAHQPARQDPAHQRRRLDSDGQSVLAITATGNNRAIWALGLRNPFTFAFQPGTGRIFINDVGTEHVGGDQRRRSRARTTAGRPREGRPPTRVPSSDLRLPHGAARRRLRDHRRHVLQPPAPSSRPPTSATTSSPTTARAGSGRSTRRSDSRPPTFATGISARWTCTSDPREPLLPARGGPGQGLRSRTRAARRPRSRTHPQSHDRRRATR